jgi:hypothetical protein
MPTGTILVIVIGCVLIAVAAGIAAALEVRLLVTRRQFGPEYDRLASKVGHRRTRAELAERGRRVAHLGIRPLDPGVRQQLASSWTAAQEAFVEDPPRAVTAASGLVLRAAKERGYPVDDREQLRADLSVHHARRLDSYRRAEQTAAALASAPVPTEDLRQALLWYRAMFRELAEPSEGPPSPALPRPTPARKRGLARYPGWVATQLAVGRRGIGRLASPDRRPKLRLPRLRVPRPRGLRGRIPGQPRMPRLPRTPRRTPRTSQRKGANQT